MVQPKHKADWTKCFICQQVTKEELQEPPKKYQSKYDVYESIATNIPKFKELYHMPMKLDWMREMALRI